MLESEPPSVSGTLIRGLVDVAREVLGRELVEGAFDAISPQAGNPVRNALPGTWVPLDMVEASFGAVARAANRDLPSLHVELARISVDRTLRRFWRMLLRLTSDEALVSRTPVIFNKSFNRGRLIPSVPAPGRGIVELVDWPRAPEWPIRGTRVGIETAMTIAGRHDVRAEVQRTPNGALYTVTWNP